MKTLATCLLSGLLLVSIASATTPDELPADWGSDVAEFAINGTYLGMTKADVTNSNAMFLRIKPPQSTLDVISYLVLSTTEDKVNIGHTRTNVVLDVVKNVYFNTDGRAVAVGAGARVAAATGTAPVGVGRGVGTNAFCGRCWMISARTRCIRPRGPP